MAIVVGVGMALFAWLFFRESPEHCGLEMDGGPGPESEPQPEGDAREMPPDPPRPRRDFTRTEALRTAAFWIVTLGIANHAMVGTGISLHIVDLGAEAGLTRSQSLGVFLPIMLISVPTGIVMGMAIDRFPMRFMIMAMMLGQVLMFGLAPHLGDPLLYTICICGWGFSGGFYGPLTVAALPNFFGRTHLGAIQGVMMMVIVIASALGPAILAAAHAYFGSYETGLHALALLPLGVFLAAPFTRDPQQP
jgi:OFA family oxalate/formate antiporter-like MFS transporter